uniref:Uncharacterized protein n=1 Tax=Caenorhabditis japonica TaxID=281687 RepID=A0A8R1ECB1_CAEJA
MFEFQELHKAERSELKFKVEMLGEELERTRRKLEIAEKAEKCETKKALKMNHGLEPVEMESDGSEDFEEIRTRIQGCSTKAGRRGSRSTTKPQAKHSKWAPEAYRAGTSKWDLESVEGKRKVSSWLEENSERRGIEDSVKLRRTQKREEERSEAESWR